MKLRTLLIASAAALASAALVAQAQVPGVNSTLQSVFTVVYEASTSKPTYSASVAGVTPASAAGDVCALRGSSTKTIRVRRIMFGGNTTATAQTEPVSVFLRSATSNYVAGTGAIVSSMKYDSNNSAATAAMEEWTANPTITSSPLGEFLDIPIVFPIGTTPSVNPVNVLEFGRLGSAIALRGTAQWLTVNLNNITITGTYNCAFEWTEE